MKAVTSTLNERDIWRDIAFQAPSFTSVQWYVTFTDFVGERTAPAFVHWFTRKNFRHCLAFRATEQGTLVCNPLGQGLYLHWAPGSAADYAQGCLRTGWPTLSFETALTTNYFSSGMMTCVSVLKALLNVRSPWVITPYQLHQQLLKSGACSLVLHSNDDQGKG